ncbi:WD40 repeat protein [Thermosporothrix hazakensis]|jgi:hypothetical protein|uniref:WD40 repeat protein n=1 Tax=Thermosporothrix hazakensis TaxID=644383 RepID=A0A326U3G1_THEHA|nr:PD40 domain-containing protein [Thermosporothrix hazakensis]PZW26625.1 WD40 repeat protein [Thermosporothrix hazakensis]GCE47675.1 hypothetical protein KTH_25440 [Thermosporothrix hazakensis]
MQTSKYIKTGLLLLILLLLAGCQSPVRKSQSTTLGNGTSVDINNELKLPGKLYFTIGRDLYVLDSSGTPRRLTHDMDIRDPAVSPDGKMLAFVIRYKNYADLAIMPTSGGKPRVLLTGKGDFTPNPRYASAISTHTWFAQPTWRDNTHLVFLSDIRKLQINSGLDTFMLDLMAYSIDINNPQLSRINPQNVDDYPGVLQHVTYAVLGDGGQRDLIIRPNHPDQIVFTGYQYTQDQQSKQLIQLFTQNINAIAKAEPGTYQPGAPGVHRDPSVALTPAQADLMNIQPAFSPDGAFLTYVRKPDLATPGMELYVMPIAEDVITRPDDKATAQKALEPYNHSTLLLKADLISQPVWSPDSKYIAYIGYEDNTFNLYLLEVQKANDTYQRKGDPILLLKASDQQARLDADSRIAWVKG